MRDDYRHLRYRLMTQDGLTLDQANKRIDELKKEIKKNAKKD